MLLDFTQYFFPGDITRSFPEKFPCEVLRIGRKIKLVSGSYDGLTKRCVLVQGMFDVAVPFLFLFLTVFVVQQFWGLLQYGIVFVSVSGSTLHMQRLVSAQQETKLYKVLDVLSIVLLNVWALSVMGLPDQEMLRNITLRPPREHFDVRHHFSPALLLSCIATV